MYARRGALPLLESWLAADAERRAGLPVLQALQKERNQLSREIGERARAGVESGELRARAGGLGARLSALQQGQEEAEKQARAAWLSLPGPLHPEVIQEDLVLWEDRPRLEKGRDHVELLGALLDREAGVRLSGARFTVLRGELAQLQYALEGWAMHRLVREGLTPAVVPVLVQQAAMEGTGFLPDGEESAYRIERDALWLTGTAEVALTMCPVQALSFKGGVNRGTLKSFRYRFFGC